MSLQHLLYRMGNREIPVHLALRASCVFPGCPTGSIEWTMRLRPSDARPKDATCPLCQRRLHVLSAIPLEGR